MPLSRKNKVISEDWTSNVFAKLLFILEHKSWFYKPNNILSHSVVEMEVAEREAENWSISELAN